MVLLRLLVAKKIARAVPPGLSAAREAAEAVPPESVRRNGNLLLLFREKKDHPNRLFFMTFRKTPFFKCIYTLQGIHV